MHIGLLRKKNSVLVRLQARRFIYDLLTTRRFRLTDDKIACVITPGLCAIQHCRKFPNVTELLS